MAGPLQQFETGFLQLYSSRLTQASSMCLIVWDHILTFPHELDFFWHRKWSYLQVLFFMNRYLALSWQIVNTIVIFSPLVTADLSVLFLVCNSFADLGSSQIGERWGHGFLEASGTITIITVHMIISLRVHGLYGRSSLVAYSLALLLVMAVAAEIYVDVTLGPTFTHLLVDKNTFICFPINTPKTFFFWVPVLVFDTIIFSMVAIKGFTHWRTMRFAGIGFSRSTLVPTLVRDSVGYFFIILSVYIINAVSWALFPIALRLLLQGYTYTITSMLASRMLFNLRLQVADNDPSFYSENPWNGIENKFWD